MTERILNFSAGPACLPLEVLQEAQAALLSLDGTGIGILEHSHRGPAFMSTYEETVSLVRELAAVPDNYHVLFIQGGASMQFAMVPMNFLSDGSTADFLDTGAWSKKAIREAARFGSTHVAASSEDRNYCYIPQEIRFSGLAEYVHYTSNNTIFGTQFGSAPEVPAGTTLVCDASSDIFSRPIDISEYGLIYAGGQKNLGPSGLTLIIIRDDLVNRGKADLPAMLQYRTFAENQSMYNTPPTFAVYLMGRVCNWILRNGALAGMQELNREKAGRLYEFLDSSSLFHGTADPDSRSQMNITFVTGDADVDAAFVREATAAGFDGLKGHRSVGGMRASIYNAFPLDGIDALITFLKAFEDRQ